MKCQMCGHEQEKDEARDGRIFDACEACGAAVLRNQEVEDEMTNTCPHNWEFSDEERRQLICLKCGKKLDGWDLENHMNMLERANLKLYDTWRVRAIHAETDAINVVWLKAMVERLIKAGNEAVYSHQKECWKRWWIAWQVLVKEWKESQNEQQKRAHAIHAETDSLEKINSWVADMVSFFGKGGRLSHEPQNWSKSYMEGIVDRAATEEIVDHTLPSDTPYVYSDGIEIKHNYGETMASIDDLNTEHQMTDSVERELVRTKELLTDSRHMLELSLIESMQKDIKIHQQVRMIDRLVEAGSKGNFAEWGHLLMEWQESKK